MSALPRTTPEMLTALADAVRGLTVDGITVHDARAENYDGVDFEPVVRLMLILDDAVPDLGTWPFETLRAIDRLARERADRLGIEEFVFVRHQGRSSADGRARPRHRTSR